MTISYIMKFLIKHASIISKCTLNFLLVQTQHQSVKCPGEMQCQSVSVCYVLNSTAIKVHSPCVWNKKVPLKV